MEGAVPNAAQGIALYPMNVASTKGTWELVYQCLLLYHMSFVSAGLAIYMLLPKTHHIRASVPAYLIGAQEGFEYQVCRVLVTNLFMLHMSLNTTYLAAAVSFFHVGAMVGSPFFACIASKAGRKIGLIVNILFASTMYIVFSVVSSSYMTKMLSANERDYYVDGNAGTRKVRAFIDPNLAKGLTNELGFEGAFSSEFNLVCLLLIFTGFTVASCGVTQTVILDLYSTEMDSRHYSLVLGGAKWWIGPIGGCLFAEFCFIHFDVDGAFIAIIFHRLICLIACLITVESKGWDRAVTVSGTPCYLKALYYALYLWPQGSWAMNDMVTFMSFDRQHLRSSTIGQITYRWCMGRLTNSVIWANICRLTYMPTIGAMFWAAAATPNPLNTSLYMEWFNEYRTLEGCDAYYIFASIYPAFVGQYMEIDSCPFFLGVCAGMRQLGHFMAISRWPNQMLCGDPMNCWRSQYLYSHALFYNCGGDQGNINYVNWYLFTKSQRRQCCCPYRKLKQDAPEKCCPPCCLGPFVEETGGCPCPCCCASCSS